MGQSHIEAYNHLFKRNRHAWIREETQLVPEDSKGTGFLGTGTMVANKFELVPGLRDRPHASLTDFGLSKTFWTVNSMQYSRLRFVY